VTSDAAAPQPTPGWPDPGHPADVSIRGRLPELPPRLVKTKRLRYAFEQFRKTVLERDITAFSGPSGTGKTTCAAYCARQVRTTFRYFQLPQTADPEEVTRKASEAVFDRSPRGAEREVANELVDMLAREDLGLIADEVHLVGRRGVQQLRYLWDEVARQNGRGCPLILIGADVTATVAEVKELRSRIARIVDFRAQTEDEILAFACELHPRLAATPTKLLRKLDHKYGAGSMRQWQQIAKEIKYLPSTELSASAALSAEDVDRICTSLAGGV
jgi:hypothetical protein